MITKHNVHRDILYIKMVPSTALPTSSSHRLLPSSVSLILHPPRQTYVFYKSKHEFKTEQKEKQNTSLSHIHWSSWSGKIKT